MEDIKAIVEAINALIEDEFVDEFVDTEVEPVELANEPTESATEELNAKTKISRALDVLVDAIDDFKNATVLEINLVDDADLGVAIESLDATVNSIRDAINGKTEAPVEELPAEEFVAEDEVEVEDQPEEIVDEEDDNFDDQAQLDLFVEE